MSDSELMLLPVKDLAIAEALFIEVLRRIDEEMFKLMAFPS